MKRTKTAPVQIYPYPYECVFDAVLEVLPRMPSTILSADRTAGTITASTAFTWRSWVEKLTVAVNPGDAGSTTVILTSTSTVQIVDWGKNTMNIDFVVGAVRSYLDHNFSHLRTDQPPSVP